MGLTFEIYGVPGTMGYAIYGPRAKPPAPAILGEGQTTEGGLSSETKPSNKEEPTRAPQIQDHRRHQGQAMLRSILFPTIQG